MDGHVKKPNFSSPSPPKLVHQPKVLSDISFNISRTLRVFVRVAASKWWNQRSVSFSLSQRITKTGLSVASVMLFACQGFGRFFFGEGVN